MQHLPAYLHLLTPASTSSSTDKESSRANPRENSNTRSTKTKMAIYSTGELTNMTRGSVSSNSRHLTSTDEILTREKHSTIPPACPSHPSQPPNKEHLTGVNLSPYPDSCIEAESTMDQCDVHTTCCFACHIVAGRAGRAVTTMLS